LRPCLRYRARVEHRGIGLDGASSPRSGPSPPLTSLTSSRLPLVPARGTRPVSGSTRGFTSSVLHRSLQHLEPPTPISPVVYSSPPRCRLLSAEPMRPPEGDDVSARARLSPPGGALRSTRLVRPARSIGRAPCLLPGARPSALLATRRELQKTLDAASPEFWHWELGVVSAAPEPRSTVYFPPYPNLSNFQTKYPHHLEPSFIRGSGSIQSEAFNRDP
jgi:hypothetical protein